MRNMSVQLLDLDAIEDFPPVEQAKSSGLLAVGGDLTPARLVKAYANGIFPWYSEDSPIMWWSPNPRCVLIPDELIISKSLEKTIKKETFTITYNLAFREVIQNCADSYRPGQHGTWIQPEVVEAYVRLNALGYAHSIEAWNNSKLVGGLYGVMLGTAFFGESMFHKESNASKVAFATMVRDFRKAGCTLIDCQQTSSHMLKFGAREISRNEFMQRLFCAINLEE